MIRGTCERCHRDAEITWYGRPPDVETEDAGNGEWLCEGCVFPRMAEIDEAIAKADQFFDSLDNKAE